LFKNILNKGIFWLTLIFVIETFLYSLFLLFSFRKFGKHIRDWKFKFPVAKSIITDSWPLMLSAVAVSIYMKIDQVMIRNMLGNEQTGIYAVVVKLSEVWYFIPGIICTSVFPSIVKNMNNKEIFEKRMGHLYFLMFWLATGIAIFITVFSYPIINILFGEAYISAVIPLRIYVWAGIAVFLGVATSQYLTAKNFTKIAFYRTVLGSLINVILNIILIPVIGIKGAAISTLVSYSASIIILMVFKKTKDQFYLFLKSVISIWS
jgi:O-antigen/teichoic acid export membrane protein